jgi:hypothetical protein
MSVEQVHLKVFFVSSVDFCKHIKFDDRNDDRKDNNVTGTQGPPGLAGGQPGPQGPPGPPGILGPQAERGFTKQLEQQEFKDRQVKMEWMEHTVDEDLTVLMEYKARKVQVY